MKGNRAVLTAIVILVIVVAGWWLFRSGAGERVDLLAQFDSRKEGRRAVQRRSTPRSAGDTKRAIAAPAERPASIFTRAFPTMAG